MRRKGGLCALDCFAEIAPSGFAQHQYRAGMIDIMPRSDKVLCSMFDDPVRSERLPHLGAGQMGQDDVVCRRGWARR